MLLNQNYFKQDTVKEHTATVMGSFDRSVPVATGDLLVVEVEDMMGRTYLLASFHGDTNGLATLPVLAAVHKLAESMPKHRLIFGLDANTHTLGSSSKQGVGEFAQAFVGYGYTSCWGDAPDPNSATTFNARTYLQPQLQKAARADEKVSKGDKNPKDYILFPRGGFRVREATKDNTGEARCAPRYSASSDASSGLPRRRSLRPAPRLPRAICHPTPPARLSTRRPSLDLPTCPAFRYIEDMVFPTLRFPSDHGIVATTLDVL